MRKLPPFVRYDFDEYVAEGMCHLALAARGFDPAKSQFSTYATVAIGRQFHRKNDRDTKHKQVPPEAAVNVVDSRNDPAKVAERRDEAAFALSRVDGRQREVLERVYLQGDSYVDVAKSWGCSPQNVRQTAEAAKQRIRASITT